MSRLRSKGKSAQPVQRPGDEKEQGGYKGLKEGGQRAGAQRRGEQSGEMAGEGGPGPEYLGPSESGGGGKKICLRIVGYHQHA